MGSITMLKSVDELRELYKDFSPDKEIISYCNKGKESAITYFSLKRLNKNVATYDGSWAEWGNASNVPIAGPSKTPLVSPATNKQ